MRELQCGYSFLVRCVNSFLFFFSFFKSKRLIACVNSFLFFFSFFKSKRLIACLERNCTYFNPFTVPTCTIFGLKAARTCLQTVYFPVLCHIYFQCYEYWWKNPFLCQCEKGGKMLKGFNFFFFFFFFTCDIMAVKGLIIIIIIMHD